MQRIEVCILQCRLQVEIAASPFRRAFGLMFRRLLPEDAGMLFVFPEDELLGFWMRNTPLPLSIAFLDSQRRILNLAEMQPFDDLNFHQSSAPARYALEANAGWFTGNSIGPGDLVEFQLPADLVIR